LDFADFNLQMRIALLYCTGFDWSRISPAIFGSLFQAVMEPRERRQIGGHYTNERDILKVIRSLFLDDLRAEFEKAKGSKAELQRFHDKLSKLRFLDPACGCGNFLVITYRELRLLEIEL
jgi:type II restriction/modification system DNA methylase subunit YeeA